MLTAQRKVVRYRKYFLLWFCSISLQNVATKKLQPVAPILRLPVCSCGSAFENFSRNFFLPNREIEVSSNLPL